MTRAGIEPTLPPWKGDVLTARLTGLVGHDYEDFNLT